MTHTIAVIALIALLAFAGLFTAYNAGYRAAITRRSGGDE